MIIIKNSDNCRYRTSLVFPRAKGSSASLLFPTYMSNLQQQPVGTRGLIPKRTGLLEINCLIPSLPLKDTMASSIEICGYGVHKLLNFSCKRLIPGGALLFEEVGGARRIF